MRKTIGLKSLFIFINVIFLFLIFSGKNFIDKKEGTLYITNKEEIYLNVFIENHFRLLKAFCALNGEYYFFLPPAADIESVILNYDEGGRTTKIFLDETNSDNIIIAPNNGRVIHVLKDNKVSSIFIDSETEITDLEEDVDRKVEARVSIYGANGLCELSGNKIKIKGHGNGSWDNEKKSWLLQFNESISILGLSKGRKYVAIANAQDPSHIRNKFVLDFAQEIGLPYTPKAEYAHFYYNGDYRGLYLIAEKIESGENRLPIKEEKELIELYKDRLQHFEDSGIRGYEWPEGVELSRDDGFLIEEGNAEGEDCAFYDYTTIKYPQYASREQMERIKEYTDNVFSAIRDENGYNERTGKYWYEYIDLDSFLKKHLVEYISKNRDANQASSYFYVLSFDEDARLCEGPIWDFDNSLGGYQGEDLRWKCPEGIIKIEPGLYKFDEFNAMLIQYYIILAKPFLEEKAEDYIRGYESRIQNAVKMDEIRWQGFEYTDMGFEDSVEFIIDFLNRRKEFFDDTWINGINYYRVNFVDNDKIISTVYVEEGSIFKEAEKKAEEANTCKKRQNFLGWYDESGEIKFDENDIIVEDMACWSKWEVQ